MLSYAGEETPLLGEGEGVEVMAGVLGPLLSLDAKGSLANGITFMHRHGHCYVRRYCKPLKPPTLAQVEVRDRVKQLGDNYRGIEPGTKGLFERMGGFTQKSGFALYTREAYDGSCPVWEL